MVEGVFIATALAVLVVGVIMSTHLVLTRESTENNWPGPGVHEKNVEKVRRLAKLSKWLFVAALALAGASIMPMRFASSIMLGMRVMLGLAAVLLIATGIVGSLIRRNFASWDRWLGWPIMLIGVIVLVVAVPNMLAWLGLLLALLSKISLVLVGLAAIALIVYLRIFLGGATQKKGTMRWATIVLVAAAAVAIVAVIVILVAY